MGPNGQFYPNDYNPNYQRYNNNQYPAPDSIQMQQQPPSYYANFSSSSVNQGSKNLDSLNSKS